PRVINILCDRALENAWSEKTHTVDMPAVVRAARSLNIDVPVSIGEQLKRFYAPAAVAAAVGAAALLVWTIGSAAVAGRTRPRAPRARAAQESPRPVPMDSRPSAPPPVVTAREGSVETGDAAPPPAKAAIPAVAAPAASTSAKDNQLLVV